MNSHFIELHKRYVTAKRTIYAKSLSYEKAALKAAEDGLRAYADYERGVSMYDHEYAIEALRANVNVCEAQVKALAASKKI